MRLVGLTVENFRCYAAPVSVRFSDLTALVGRNDVGKSSLINMLCNHKGLAKTSSTPGKTQTVNLFKINNIRRAANPAR